MSATDRPRPLLVVADAGARLVRRGLVAPGDAVRWDGARVVVFRRAPVVRDPPAACVAAPPRPPYLPRDSQPARAHPVVHPGVRRCAPRMTLALHNTLTRRVEPFQPLAPPRVTLYTCGPTVWNYAHLGNFRTFLFEDLLRRYLEAAGYDVFHIMNLTDVDDRTIKGARAWRATSTPRTTRATSRSGRRPAPTTTRSARRGTRRSAGAAPGGTSNAPPCRCTRSGRGSACRRSTSTRAAWT